MGEGPNAEDWANEALSKTISARMLVNGNQWRDAYSMAGIALECALKGCIMRRLRFNRWPSRADRPDLYTHDLRQLARLGGLVAALEAEILGGTKIGLAWAVAQSYNLGRRYPDGERFPYRWGRDMVDAVDTFGLVQWLNSR